MPRFWRRRKQRDPISRQGSRDRDEQDLAWAFAPMPGEDQLEIRTNYGALFDESDRDWLEDDPGEEIRRRNH